MTVTLPDKNCILGDKLTAFAPHTTGIPFGINKELEIIKQMFDCWTLLQEMDNYKLVAEAYDHVSRIELGYRGLDATPEDCLKDTIESCICIIGRGSIRPEDYTNFSIGINAIQNHIFSGRFNGENACLFASEIMYLAACLLTKQEKYDKVTQPESYMDLSFKIKGIKKISGFRNTNPIPYAYIVKAFKLLQKIGLYLESI